MNDGAKMVLEAAEKTAELIRTLDLPGLSVSLGTLYEIGNPQINVHVTYMSEGQEVHRSLHVNRYCHNPVGVYSCGWFPLGFLSKVIDPLTALGYRARI